MPHVKIVLPERCNGKQPEACIGTKTILVTDEGQEIEIPFLNKITIHLDCIDVVRADLVFSSVAVELPKEITAALGLII